MGQHKNAEQNEIFVNFMKKHKNLARGFAKSDRVHSEQLWEELAKQLNSSGPPTKEVTTWKKVWTDMKRSVKQRLAHNKVKCSKTGSGLFNKYKLSATDDQIAVICGFYTSVHRVPNVKTFGVPMNEKPTSLVGTANDQEALPDSDVSATSSDSPLTSPVQSCESDNQTSVSINSTTSIYSRNRKRHISDTEYVRNMEIEVEQFSKISKNIDEVKKEIKENRIVLTEISKNIREITKLKENELEELKRHHFVLENSLQTKNELKLKFLKLEQLKLGVRPTPSPSPSLSP